MNKHSTTKVLISLYALLLLFCVIVLSNELSTDLYSIEDIWLRLFGYGYINEQLSIINIIWVTMPTIIVISCFADSVCKEVNRNAQYIFIRTSKKGHILITKIISLLFQYLKAKILTSTIALALIILRGYRTNFMAETIRIVILQTILNIGVEYFMVILCNILSLQINSISGYIITITLYLLCTIIFCSFYYQNKIELWSMPFVQQISPVKVIHKYMVPTNISYIKLVITESLYILLIMVYGRYVIKRKEFYQGDYS